MVTTSGTGDANGRAQARAVEHVHAVAPGPARQGREVPRRVADDPRHAPGAAERVAAQLELGVALELGEQVRQVAGRARARQGERRDVDADSHARPVSQAPARS